MSEAEKGCWTRTLGPLYPAKAALSAVEAERDEFFQTLAAETDARRRQAEAALSEVLDLIEKVGAERIPVEAFLRACGRLDTDSERALGGQAE